MMYAYPGSTNSTGAPGAYQLEGGGSYLPGYASHLPASENAGAVVASTVGGGTGMFSGPQVALGYESSPADSAPYMSHIPECSLSSVGACGSSGVSPEGNASAAMRGGPPALFSATRGKPGRSIRNIEGNDSFAAGSCNSSAYLQNSNSSFNASHSFFGGEASLSSRGGAGGRYSSFSSGGGFPPRLRKEGDWECSDPACGNINFSKRTRCNRCGKARGKVPTGPPPPGPPPGPLPAPHLGGPPGIFRQGDWPCVLCGNVNWARRSTCNICSAPKPHSHEEQPRTGRGGGHFDLQDPNDRRRHDSDDEDFDEFGRKKRKPQQQQHTPSDASSSATTMSSNVSASSSLSSEAPYHPEYQTYTTPAADGSRAIQPTGVGGEDEDSSLVSLQVTEEKNSENKATGGNLAGNATTSSATGTSTTTTTTTTATTTGTTTTTTSEKTAHDVSGTPAKEKTKEDSEENPVDSPPAPQQEGVGNQEFLGEKPPQLGESVWHPAAQQDSQTAQQLYSGETLGYTSRAAVGRGILSSSSAYPATSQRSTAISAFAGEGVIKLAFPPAPKRPRASSYDTSSSSSSSDSDSDSSISSRKSSSPPPSSHRRRGGHSSNSSSATARRRSRSRSSSRQRSSRSARSRNLPKSCSNSSVPEGETAGGSRRSKRW